MRYHVTQKTATVLFGKIPELPLLFFVYPESRFRAETAMQEQYEFSLPAGDLQINVNGQRP